MRKMLRMQDLIIDPDFEAVFAEDRHEEWQLEALLASVRKNGWTTPIQHWHGLLVDGHTRYAIWQEHFKGDPDFPEPELRELHFASKDEALEYIKSQQRDRRNLSAGRLRYFRGKEMAQAMEPVSNGKPEGHGGKGSSQLRRSKQKGGVQAAAKKKGVSRATAYRDEEFAKHVDSLVERGVAPQEELLKVSPKIVAKAAQATTNSQAKAELQKPRRAPQAVPGDANEIAKRFASPLRQLQELNKQFPKDNFPHLEAEIRAWCAEAIRGGSSEPGQGG